MRVSLISGGYVVWCVGCRAESTPLPCHIPPTSSPQCILSQPRTSSPQSGSMYGVTEISFSKRYFYLSIKR
ncbi:MAG: hypothetical protein IKQ70_07580 [Bacteroidales bacterium]|nr:hypothetical protein [Bacteroidales bacterium]